MVEKTLEKIEQFSPIIKDSFQKWAKTGKSSDTAIEGYCFDDLVKKYGMKPVGAFITLDWLIREPEKAKASLAKGIR